METVISSVVVGSSRTTRSGKMTSFRRGKSIFPNLVWMLLVVIILGENRVKAAEQQKQGDSSIPEQMMAPLSSSFMKLIPQFNPTAFTLQFKTDARIALSPTNPSLVPFLLQYHALAMNEIGQSSSEDATFRAAMTTYFNSEYGKFISEIGLPIGCISFYAGATEVANIQQLESLSKTLNNYGGVNGNSNGPQRNTRLFAGISGDELAHRLNLDLITRPFSERGLTKASSKGICDKIFWILKDGTVVANLPSTDLSSRQVWIPTLATSVNIYNVNVTHELSQYFSIGVNCLDDILTKRNFSSTVTKWMSSKLIPQILQSQKCLPGFPRILQLLISIELYKHTLVYVQRQQVHHIPPHPPSPVYYDNGGGDYYHDPVHEEPYVGPLQPIKPAGSTDEGAQLSRAGFSGTLLTVLIVFFIIFACCCCCCCLVPLCCPDLKTCARMQKIFLRAKRSLDKLRNQKPQRPNYKPIFEDEEDDDEEDADLEDEEEEIEEVKPKRKKRPVRKHRTRNKPVVCEKRCRPKIQIPICSDTSINICVTTEDDDECCISSTDDQKIGYISKELDTAFYQYSDENDEEEDEPSPVIKNKRPQKSKNAKQRMKKNDDDDCAFDPVHQKELKEKPYHFTGKHAKPAPPRKHYKDDDDDNFGDRYDDAARRGRKQKNDMKKRKSDEKNPNNWLPQNFNPDDMAAQMKSKYYDKLVTDWKYKRATEGAPNNNEQQQELKNSESLGPPPPPRQHHNKADRNSIPF